MNNPLQPLVESEQLTQFAEIIEILPSDTNQCWLVRDEGRDHESPLFVVKLLRHDSLSVNWQQLVDNTQQAEAEQLTPPLIYADTESGYLLMPYRNQKNLQQSGWTKRDKILYLAKAAATIHSSSMQFQPMDLYEEVAGYIHLVKNVNAKAKFLSELACLPHLSEESYFKQQEFKPSHLDLSFANVLENGEVLDWEFARQALPLVDIAFSATINQLTATESRYLYDCYIELQLLTEPFEAFEVYCQWSQLLNRVWYFIAKETSA